MSNRKQTVKIGEALRQRGKTPKPDVVDIWNSPPESQKPVKPKRVSLTSKKIKSKFKQQKTSVATRVTKVKTKRPSRAKRSFAFKSLFIFKPVYIGLFVIALILVGLFSLIGSGSNSNFSNDIAVKTQDQKGVSTESSNGNGITQNGIELPTVSSTDFEILYPLGTPKSELSIVDVSPPEQPNVYAYIDVLDGVDIKLSQQQLPESFIDDESAKLLETAENFNAKNVIQIDDYNVYHGYTDNNGGVQSLVFIKEGLLIFAVAPKEIDDNLWAAYISSLK